MLMLMQKAGSLEEVLRFGWLIDGVLGGQRVLGRGGRLGL
jgi:hypothetical protein